MKVSVKAKEELSFWANLPSGLSTPITLPPAVGTVTTDASEQGLGILYDGILVSEEISEEFSSFHINVKELLALDR